MKIRISGNGRETSYEGEERVRREKKRPLQKPRDIRGERRQRRKERGKW